jgi:hypothetical protein
MVVGCIIPSDETLPLVESPFEELEDYQHAVDGYIELLHLPDSGLTIVVNEEGKPRHLVANRRATWLWWLHAGRTKRFDVLRGDVVLLGPAGSSNLAADLPDQYRELLFRTERFRLDLQLPNTVVSWVNGEPSFDSYFEAARVATHLSAAYDWSLDVKILPA